MSCWAPEPWAAPRMTAGAVGQSRARSRLVTTMAWPPSDSWQQSSRRSGSTIQRDAWWSSKVMGLP